MLMIVLCLENAIFHVQVTTSVV